MAEERVESRTERGLLRPEGDTPAWLLLLALIAVAPYPYGAVLPAGTAMVEVLAFLVVVSVFATRRATIPSAARLPLLGGVLLALHGLFQLAPLGGAVATLSPQSGRVYHEANEVLRLFGRNELTARISVAPQETVNAILLTLACSAAFLGASLVLRTRGRRRIFLYVLFANVLVQIILGSAERGPDSRVSGSFVNPNHLAGYCEIALALAFGYLWAEVLTGRDRIRDLPDRGDRLAKRIPPLAAKILVWGGIAGAIALTRSRGGILSAVLTTVVLIALATLQRGRRARRSRIAAAAIAAVIAGILFVAVSTREVPLTRFMQSDPRDIGSDTRLQVWKLSLEAWRDYPLFGSGLGAFKEAFRSVQPRDLHGLVDYAHNDPLQLLVSGGIIGLLFGALAYGGSLVTLFRKWTVEQHREESAIILGSLGALLSIAFHGFAEFNLSVPAIAVTLSAVAGLGVAASRDASLSRR